MELKHKVSMGTQMYEGLGRNYLSYLLDHASRLQTNSTLVNDFEKRNGAKFVIQNAVEFVRKEKSLKILASASDEFKEEVEKDRIWAIRKEYCDEKDNKLLFNPKHTQEGDKTSIRGLINWIIEENPDAVVCYDIYDADVLERYYDKLFISERTHGIPDRLNIFEICNDAHARKMWWRYNGKTEREKFGGLEVIKIDTEYGHHSLLVHDEFNRFFADEEGISMPVSLGLRISQLDYLIFEEDNMETTPENIVCSGAFTYLLKNVMQGYHGIMFPNSHRMKLYNKIGLDL